jgi:hypothetical protein
MLNRWSAVMLVVGAVAGYAFGAPPAGAQSADVPFGPGDRVSLRLQSDAEGIGSRDFTCVVGTLQGRWVRCDSTDPFRPRTGEVWYSLESVLRIQKTPR